MNTITGLFMFISFHLQCKNFAVDCCKEYLKSGPCEMFAVQVNSKSVFYLLDTLLCIQVIL